MPIHWGRHEVHFLITSQKYVFPFHTLIHAPYLEVSFLLNLGIPLPCCIHTFNWITSLNACLKSFKYILFKVWWWKLCTLHLTKHNPAEYRWSSARTDFSNIFSSSLIFHGEHTVEVNNLKTVVSNITQMQWRKLITMQKRLQKFCLFLKILRFDGFFYTKDFFFKDFTNYTR